VPLGDLPSVHEPFPDEAHEAIRRYVDQTTVGVDDLAMGMQALAQLASTFFAALDSSVADRASLHTADTTETTRAKAAEQANADAITAEVTRAKAAEKALSDRVTALEARTLVGTTGQLTKTLPLLLGSVTTFDVVFRNPMPTTDYIPLVTLDATSVAVLGSITVQLPITAKTKTGCTVSVRNTALLTVASSVTVYVAALALS